MISMMTLESMHASKLPSLWGIFSFFNVFSTGFFIYMKLSVFRQSQIRARRQVNSSSDGRLTILTPPTFISRPPWDDMDVWARREIMPLMSRMVLINRYGRQRQPPRRRKTRYEIFGIPAAPERREKLHTPKIDKDERRTTTNEIFVTTAAPERRKKLHTQKMGKNGRPRRIGPPQRRRTTRHDVFEITAAPEILSATETQQRDEQVEVKRITEPVPHDAQILFTHRNGRRRKTTRPPRRHRKPITSR
jgi:hypothetical protein